MFLNVQTFLVRRFDLSSFRTVVDPSMETWFRNPIGKPKLL